MKSGVGKPIATFVFAAVVCLASACGQNANQTLPTPTPPPGGSTQPLTPPTTTIDPRLPALEQVAVEYSLPKLPSDNTQLDYSGLNALAGFVQLPVVQTSVALQFPNTRDTSIEGSVLVGFEDNVGFWGDVLSSFPGTSERASDHLDMFFSDPNRSIRVYATINGDVLNGTIYYRIRQTGETGCEKPVWTCSGPDSSYCPAPPADTSAADCKTYLNLGNAAVKTLGTFIASYSAWAQ